MPFVLHLGDIIDGRPLTQGREALGSDPERMDVVPVVLNELDEVLNALKLLPGDVEVIHSMPNSRFHRFAVLLNQCIPVLQLYVVSGCNLN